MIKAVIFDVGGVLIRTESHESRRLWERKLGLANWESEQLVFNSEMGQKAQLGAVTYADLWQWLGQHLQLDSQTLTEFHAGFWAGDVLDKGMVEMIRRLKEGGYQTAVISNYSDILRPTLTNTYAIADAFDVIVISAEEKVMKPDAVIYERALARLGRQPEEAVFIDDFAHNIKAARTLGMAAIHYRPTIDLADELAQLNVHVASSY